MQIASIILSAGKGSRMNSDLPKPFHKIAGEKMIDWVINVNESLKIDELIIVAPNEQDFSNYNQNYKIAIQNKANGTGDAVNSTKKYLITFKGVILICYADTPFISKKTLMKLINSVKNGSKIAITCFNKDKKNTYGKVVLSNKKTPLKIIEDKKAEIDIKLCNGGVMACNSSILFKLLNQIRPDKITKEFYLTEIIALAAKSNFDIDLIKVDEYEILGINDRLDLARAEKIAQNMFRQNVLKKGVTLKDPKTIYFSYNSIINKDTIIHPNVIIGNNVKLEKNSEIFSFTHLEDCIIKENNKIGPFARIRGTSIIGENSKIGNFVEIKKSRLKENVKVNHLSYIGDTKIGSNSNVGAGTITCNYDGFKKNETTIGSETFIGSNSTLVAPLKIGDNATVGAGSVITENIPKNALSIARKKQINKKDRSIQRKT